MWGVFLSREWGAHKALASLLFNRVVLQKLTSLFFLFFRNNLVWNRWIKFEHFFPREWRAHKALASPLLYYRSSFHYFILFYFLGNNLVRNRLIKCEEYFFPGNDTLTRRWLSLYSIKLYYWNWLRNYILFFRK